MKNTTTVKQEKFAPIELTQPLASKSVKELHARYEDPGMFGVDLRYHNTYRRAVRKELHARQKAILASTRIQWRSTGKIFYVGPPVASFY